MAEIPGVKITGTLVPTDTTDIYPATSELYHHGGYKSVANEAERLSITLERRKEGMLVYQADTEEYWTLKYGVTDSNWVVADLGGSGGLEITPDRRPVFPQTEGIVAYSPSFVDNGDGSAEIGNTQVTLYATNNYYVPLARYYISGATFTFTEGKEEYVCISYNGGSPAFVVGNEMETSAGSVVVFIVWRYGNTLNYISTGKTGEGLASKTHEVLLEADFCKQSLLYNNKMSETNTPLERIVVSSHATVFVGSNRVTQGFFNSNYNTLYLAVNTGSTWGLTVHKSYDNFHINPSDAGLVEVSSNDKYVIRWYYRRLNGSVIYYVLGESEHDSEELARTESPRTDLPLFISRGSILIGRSIIKKGATSGVTSSDVSVAPAIVSQDGSNAEASDPVGYAPLNYLKSGDVLDDRYWDYTPGDDPLVLSEEPTPNYISFRGDKCFKLVCTAPFTTTEPYHISTRFVTGKEAVYEFSVVMEGSFEDYSWDFSIYDTDNTLVTKIDTIGHFGQQKQNVVLETHTEYILGIKRKSYYPGGRPDFLFGDLMLTEVSNVLLSHNDLIGRDNIGNHNEIIPSGNSFLVANASYSCALFVDVNNGLVGLNTQNPERIFSVQGKDKLDPYDTETLASFTTLTNGSGGSVAKNSLLFVNKVEDDPAQATHYLMGYLGNNIAYRPSISISSSQVVLGIATESNAYDEDYDYLIVNTNQIGLNHKTVFYNQINKPYRLVSGNTTLTASNYYVECSGTASPYTITLPNASTTGAGKEYVIKRTGTQNVHITAQSGQTIDGHSTINLTSQYDSVTIVSNGSNKWIVV